MTATPRRPQPTVDFANLLALARADYTQLLTAALAC